MQLYFILLLIAAGIIFLTICAALYHEGIQLDTHRAFVTLLKGGLLSTLVIACAIYTRINQYTINPATQSPTNCEPTNVEQQDPDTLYLDSPESIDMP